MLARGLYLDVSLADAKQRRDMRTRQPEKTQS
ncbi:MAG: hypothetical protein DID90_2727554288 [Candidatus Nitrotoga sp. LAW]|nr:MAG: hypothetical protein DID90_2727554288 [Candidatus Nitrotoga sp. LAW]